MQDDNNCSNQADGAAELAQCSQLLVEEVRSKDGTDEHTQSSKRGDENSWGESVCGKVADFSKTN